MKKFFIGTACAVFIPCGTTLLHVSLSDSAYAGSQSKAVVCEIPLARPTGGNTLQRIFATQMCEQVQLRNQQTLTNTSVRESVSNSQNQDPNQKIDSLDPKVCQMPNGESTQVKQQCNLVP
ncbi:MAG: hypothetical protein KME23_01475 [Goleter apudmare HA4340-LM2]|jgi:hypothetical protein|nr:hypothetical protein [Goleter apudmare HA4340-LM2]